MHFQDTFKSTCIALNTKTHQCIASKLPDAQGYRWESICKPKPQILGSTRDSEEVDGLYKKEVHDRLHVVHMDVDAIYMWIRSKVRILENGT